MFSFLFFFCFVLTNLLSRNLKFRKLLEENLTLERKQKIFVFASRSSIYTLTHLNAHYICERRKDFPFQNFTYIGVFKFYSVILLQNYYVVSIDRHPSLSLGHSYNTPSCYNAFVVSSRRNSLYVYRLLNFIHSP